MEVLAASKLLLASIRDSREFLEYKRLKDSIYEDEALKGMLKRYKLLKFKYETQLIAKEEPDEELKGELSALTEALSFNNKAAEYLNAEYKLTSLINEVYRMIGDACELDIDVF